MKNHDTLRAPMDTSDQSRQDWFENAWELREEKLYPALFGDMGSGIYTLDPDLFITQFSQTSIDPRWPLHGVFESSPSPTGQTWLYVSSGLSNAWEAQSPSPGGWSGLGCEFILECPSQSPWALLLLQRMVAFQILLNVGRYEGKVPLSVWDRIPLRAPIDGSSSALNWLLLVRSPKFGKTQQLPSGRFDLLQFIGVTEEEVAYARTMGGEKLLELLQERGAAPVTDPARLPIHLDAEGSNDR